MCNSDWRVTIMMPRVSGVVLLVVAVVFLPCVRALPKFPYAQSFLFSGPRDSNPTMHISGEPFPDDVVSVELRESEGRAGLALQHQKMLEDLRMEQAPLAGHSSLPQHERDTGTMETRSKRGDLQRESDSQTGSITKTNDALLSLSEHADLQPTYVPRNLESEAEGHVMKPRHMEFGSPYLTKANDGNEGVRENKSTILSLRTPSVVRKHGDELKARLHRRRKANAGGTRKLLRTD